MDKKITIAIDGYSSTGKSTLAKELARALGYAYVDTGAMYRAITLFAMRQGYINDESLDKQSLVNSLPFLHLRFEFNPTLGFGEMLLNDENVESQIRTIEVSDLVSLIAEISEVRAKLVEQQKRMGSEKGIVMDGRDIGTVVFPDAGLKIFMTADAPTRARRRYEELLAKGHSVSFEKVLINIEERDHIDTHRADSPLRRADDAYELDNSALTRDEQFEIVAGLAQKVIARS